MAKNYSVFISHSWNHVNDLKKLRDLLEERGYFPVEFEEVTPDEKINSNSESYIKKCLKEKISNSDIVLAIAGIYASYSDWMKWELDIADKKAIPIIGIIPWGQKRISSVVKEKAVEIVSWQTEKIIEAIRKWT